MHDLLFQNQRALDRANLESYAATVGLDLARFRSALDGDAHVPAIEAEQSLLTARGATGTPSSFVNGRNLRGAQPIEAFVLLIDEELARARDRIRAGTSRSQLYAEIARTGATSPQFVSGTAPAAAAPAVERYTIAVPSDAPVRGARRAQVTIQIFTDFQCPFCARAVPTIDQLLAAYPNNVRLVFRHYPLPFHEHAMLAHEAAWEVKLQAGDAAFWRYYRRLFENQQTLERPHLERFARDLGGIDMVRFRRALDQNTHRPRIEADMDAVRRSGARIGTPSFLVGDRLIEGARPYESFRDAVEDELSP
jgi:protein-disulfide isomerase